MAKDKITFRLEMTYMNDATDEFSGFGDTAGDNTMKCPHCGAEVACSMFLEDEVVCQKCGEKFKKRENKE